jgi:non-ribosomal peptide synthetase component E (peptide arylation enzyme)
MAWGVPAQLADLADLCAEETPALALREVRTGGAVLAPEIAKRLRAHVAPEVVTQWGMSELGGGSMTRHGDHDGAATIGFPFPGSEARIVDGSGRELGMGEVGHLEYRRADMFRGYFGDAAGTTEALTRDGWMKTGDLAARDARGRLVYHGRSKDIINRGGFKVSAHEIERCLAEMPAIGQLAIVALPDARLGERACLVLSTRRGHALDLGAVQRFLSHRGVAKYKWPESIVMLDRLPETPSGKVKKSAVRELVRRGRGGP